MTLVQLRYAITLDRYKNYAAAANELLITQPTLTLQVQKLERYLGFQLFDRTKTPITTTKSGEKFLKQARNVLNEYDKLDYLFKVQHDKIEGELNVGFIPTVATYLLTKLLPILYKKYKSLQLKVFEITTNQIQKYLENGDLDIGILATPLKNNRLVETPLYYEPFNLYVSPSFSINENPISLEIVKEYPMLILSDEHCFREQTLKVCSKFSLGRIETGSFETIKKLVDNNLGITLLPEFEDVQDKTRKRALQSPVPAREISTVTTHSFYKQALLKTLQKEILSIIPNKFHKKGELHIIGVID